MGTSTTFVSVSSTNLSAQSTTLSVLNLTLAVKPRPGACGTVGLLTSRLKFWKID